MGGNLSKIIDVQERVIIPKLRNLYRELREVEIENKSIYLSNRQAEAESGEVYIKLGDGGYELPIGVGDVSEEGIELLEVKNLEYNGGSYVRASSGRSVGSYRVENINAGTDVNKVEIKAIVDGVEVELNDDDFRYDKYRVNDLFNGRRDIIYGSDGDIGEFRIRVRISGISVGDVNYLGVETFSGVDVDWWFNDIESNKIRGNEVYSINSGIGDGNDVNSITLEMNVRGILNDVNNFFGVAKKYIGINFGNIRIESRVYVDEESYLKYSLPVVGGYNKVSFITKEFSVYNLGNLIDLRNLNNVVIEYSGVEDFSGEIYLTYDDLIRGNIGIDRYYVRIKVIGDDGYTSGYNSRYISYYE